MPRSMNYSFVSFMARLEKHITCLGAGIKIGGNKHAIGQAIDSIGSSILSPFGWCFGYDA